MVIYSCMIAIQNPEDQQIYVVQRDYQLSSVNFLMRNEVKNSFKFVVRQSFPCLAKNTRNSVTHQDKICHIQMSSKSVAAYAFVDKQYPERVIFGFLKKILQIFFEKMGDKWKAVKADDNLNIEAITQQFLKFQDPSKVDKLTYAQGQIDETKVVLHQSVKKLLQKQGDLDKLVQKSKDLSEGAKQFYKSSKKMDKSCCSLI